MKLVIASANMHKVREFREMLKPFTQWDILSLAQFPDYQPPEETGSTFQENAILKAEHAAKHLQMWALADDSGLVVPSLNNQPGVHSRRYAGEEASDGENRKKLLVELQGKSDLERSAYFECCLAIANGEGLKKCARGTCEGLILTEERGRNGFGYDPLFLKYDYNKTFGEMDEGTKNRISHRRKAFEQLLLFLESHFS